MRTSRNSLVLHAAAALSSALVLVCVSVLFVNVSVADDGKAAESQARAIFQATGVQGGLVVHIGSGDGRLSTALCGKEGVLVHGLDVNEANVAEARKYAASLKKGRMIAFEVLGSERLPLIDNTVNLLVAEDLGRVSPEEVMRVLAPRGIAYVKKDGVWKKDIKPCPPEYDDWTHYLHGPDGHVMSKDLAVGPPFHVQWAGEPDHAKSHTYLTSVNVMVTGRGRLFYIADEGVRALPSSLPSRWSLFARDAFNGIVLWKRPLASWQPSYLKDRNCYPADLHRRIVAGENVVFCTLGIFAPVSALDAATGATVMTYRDTERAEEIIHDAGVLFVVINNAAQEAIDRRAMAYAHVEPRAKRIMAIRAKDGEVFWVKSDVDTDGLMPMTLASKDNRLYFQNSKGVVCLDASSGKMLWKSPRASDYLRPGWSSPNLTVFDEVVISADRQSGPGQKVGKDTFAAGGFSTGDLVAFSTHSGQRLWSAPCAEGGRAPTDVFSVGGRVWYGEHLERSPQDYRSIRDLGTGRLLQEMPLSDQWPTQHHHRCYQDKATPAYILAGRTGVEFIDLKTGEITPHNWVRGGCKFGILPSYGLLYAPPDQCGCYIESRLTGFHALAPKRLSDVERAETKAARLVKGPAYGNVQGSNVQGSMTGGSHSPPSNPHSPLSPPSPPSNPHDPAELRFASVPDGARIPDPPPSDWPTYRHDAARTGRTAAAVPVALHALWQAKLGGRLTQPVVADGRLFVASIDDHALFILDAATGRIIKSFVAGGRIDSPPTIADHLAVFGCRDGWVYALRCSDGELAWRFRAAPDEDKLVAKGQVESVWPVHGSVLVQDSAVYCCAGRSSYLDGGVRMVKLDLPTGRLILEKNYYSRDPQTGKTVKLYPSFLDGTKDKLAKMEMPGVLPDVLSSDGKRLWMRAVTFDSQLEIQHEFPAHLFSSMGFLDDSWWELSYWIYGEHCYSGRAGIDHAKGLSPSARIMVFDASRVYGYQDETFSKAGLVAMSKKPAIQTSAGKKSKKKAGDTLARDWRTDVPLYPQGMVLAGDVLFLAGPRRFDESKTRLLMSTSATDDFALPPLLQDASETFAGKKGGVVWAVDIAHGEKRAEIELDSIPVFDGLIAASGRLYLSLKDGSVACLAPPR